MIKRLLVTGISVILGVAGIGVQAAELNAGDLLTIGTGSWFAVDADGAGAIDAVEMVSIAPGTDGGVRIGSTQAAGAIDTWTWFATAGSHYTTVAPVGDTTSGIDFSGWSIFYGGSPVEVLVDYGAWTPTNCASLGCAGVDFIADVAAFSWSGNYGDGYSLWYSWSFLNAEPGIFEPTNYVLHLEGTVQPVPVPAAVWLFGSGLLGLVGAARRKVQSSDLGQARQA